MISLVQSASFAQWLTRLKDDRGRARIVARLRSASFGNFGDCRPVGEGVSEMRIDVGPGYRVYFMRHGATTYLLLAGGDKSTQSKDIARAIDMARSLREQKR
ncbi:MAG TPA: type II toxin-antitoxin system RelE/ParE family toxin [Reyranella sp.]|nr:type II toxin-antitoxin system RelE/ParE family toxin [Reyranella sp.]